MLKGYTKFEVNRKPIPKLRLLIANRDLKLNLQCVKVLGYPSFVDVYTNKDGMMAIKSNDLSGDVRTTNNYISLPKSLNDWVSQYIKYDRQLSANISADRWYKKEIFGRWDDEEKVIIFDLSEGIK